MDPFAYQTFIATLIGGVAAVVAIGVHDAVALGIDIARWVRARKTGANR